MGIFTGNARIAGSNQKNRWIVFFSSISVFPYVLYVAMYPFVRRYRRTDKIEYFRKYFRMLYLEGTKVPSKVTITVHLLYTYTYMYLRK